MNNLCELKRKNIEKPSVIMTKNDVGIPVASFTLAQALPMLAIASVESSLSAVQTKLVGTLLPLAAICGLVIAGFSFVAGHPSARQHLILAIFGAIIGFGAESIVALIRALIH